MENPDIPAMVPPLEVPADRADERKLGSLHGVVAEYLTLAIASGMAPPALVGAAITFLKNNSITASAVKNEALEALTRQLGERNKRGGRLTKAGMDEAVQAFEAMQGGMGLQ